MGFDLLFGKKQKVMSFLLAQMKELKKTSTPDQTYPLYGTGFLRPFGSKRQSRANRSSCRSDTKVSLDHQRSGLFLSYRLRAWEGGFKELIMKRMSSVGINHKACALKGET